MSDLVDKEMDKFKTTAIKALLSLTPFGSAAVSVWSDIQSAQNEKRLERLEEFRAKIEYDLSSAPNPINGEYINNSEFIDTLEKTIFKIVNERSSTKRELFRRILLNSIIEESYDFDKTEKYLKVLDNLQILEVQLLNIFYNPEPHYIYLEDVKVYSSGPENNYSQRGYIGILLQDYIKSNVDDIVDSMLFLEREGLIRFRSVAGIENEPFEIFTPKLLLEKHTTYFGHNFYRYLKEKL